MSIEKHQNIWTFIQDSMEDIENLINQKDYNISMLKSRQTLEQMVKYLYKNISDESNIDLIDMIDELYSNNLISKASLENYHKIRMIGNKAAHNNDSNSYNATNAFSLLNREVSIFFNDQYVKQRKYTTKFRGSSEKPLKKRKKILSRKKQQELTFQKLVSFAIIPLLIVLVILIFKYCSKKNNTETLASSIAIEETTTIKESISENIQQESDAQIYITTNNLNIRSAPSTDSSKINTVAKGTELVFIKKYDAEWSIINFNNAQAYVSSKYIKPKQ